MHELLGAVYEHRHGDIQGVDASWALPGRIALWATIFERVRVRNIALYLGNFFSGLELRKY
jgi:hypothetical protein